MQMRWCILETPEQTIREKMADPPEYGVSRKGEV